MAKLKLEDKVIEVGWSDKGIIQAVISNTDEIEPSEVERMNENLELLLGIFIPQTGLFGFSATNAVAKWLANGFGDRAEIIEYDEDTRDPNHIY